MPYFYFRITAYFLHIKRKTYNPPIEQKQQSWLIYSYISNLAYEHCIDLPSYDRPSVKEEIKYFFSQPFFGRENKSFSRPL